MANQQVLTQYITKTLLRQQDGSTLGPDDNLLRSGLIDSLAVMELIKYIEQEFSITVHPGEITLKNFKTINAMSNFIDTKTTVQLP